MFVLFLRNCLIKKKELMRRIRGRKITLQVQLPKFLMRHKCPGNIGFIEIYKINLFIRYLYCHDLIFKKLLFFHIQG